MAVPIDVPVLVVGGGPAPVTVAKMLAARGVTCLLVGHTAVPRPGPVTIGPAALEVLEANGLIDVLRPYFDRDGESQTLWPDVYESVVRQHCIADINVIVYDEVTIVDLIAGPSGVDAVMTDGRSRWELHSSELVDGSELPTSLSDAIVAAADVVRDLTGRYQP